MARDGILPDFLIGGAPRSGTTFLCHALDRHREIFLAKPFIPEPKVFMGPQGDDASYRTRYQELFRDAPPQRILGEKTSYYLESEAACLRIRQFLPDVRLLFVVREPIARAYSNYLWSRKNGLERLDFEEAIELEGKRADPMPPEQSYARPFDYLTRGDYAKFARRYYAAFERKQVKFVLFEQIAADPESFFGEVQSFLGVTRLPAEQLDVGVVNSARVEGLPLDSELARRLRGRMSESVARFAEIAGVDVSLWGYEI